MTRVLVTGANGFVGAALVRELKISGSDVVGLVRRPCDLGAGIETRVIDDLFEDCARAEFFDGVDAVVHLAARVHRMGDDGEDRLDSYLRDNTETTRRLAEAAAGAGVRRLIFLSSVKANGEEASRPYTEADTPAPEDPYGISKWRAEQALADIAAATELEIVNLRPPLVYGPGVRANFGALVRISDTGLPLPLGGLDGNARSLIYLGNLTAAIRLALEHPSAGGRTYLVRDGEDLSTAELVRRLRRAFGRSARLVRMPHGILKLLAAAGGRRATFRRVAGSLTIDDALIRRDLDWRPPFTVDQGLAATAAWHRAYDR